MNFELYRGVIATLAAAFFCAGTPFAKLLLVRADPRLLAALLCLARVPCFLPFESLPQTHAANQLRVFHLRPSSALLIRTE